MGWAHHFLPDETELAEHYPTRAEKAADGAVHAIGLLLAAIGGAALFIRTLTIGHAAAAGAAAAADAAADWLAPGWLAPGAPGASSKKP